MSVSNNGNESNSKAGKPTIVTGWQELFSLSRTTIRHLFGFHRFADLLAVPASAFILILEFFFLHFVTELCYIRVLEHHPKWEVWLPSWLEQVFPLLCATFIPHHIGIIIHQIKDPIIEFDGKLERYAKSAESLYNNVRSQAFNCIVEDLKFYNDKAHVALTNLIQALRDKQFAVRLYAHMAINHLRPSFEKFKGSFVFCRDRTEALPNHIEENKVPTEDELIRALENLKIDDFEWILESVKDSWYVASYSDLHSLFAKTAQYLGASRELSKNIRSVCRLVIFPPTEHLDVLNAISKTLSSEQNKDICECLISACDSLAKTNSGSRHASIVLSNLIETDTRNELINVIPENVKRLSTLLGVDMRSLTLFLLDLIRVEWLMDAYAKKVFKGECRTIYSNETHYSKHSAYGRKLEQLHHEDALLIPLIEKYRFERYKCIGTALLESKVLVAALENTGTHETLFRFYSSEEMCLHYRQAFDAAFDSNPNPRSFSYENMDEFYERLFQFARSSELRDWLRRFRKTMEPNRLIQVFPRTDGPNDIQV
jgi:hypothetical protein